MSIDVAKMVGCAYYVVCIWAHMLLLHGCHEQLKLSVGETQVAGHVPHLDEYDFML